MAEKRIFPKLTSSNFKIEKLEEFHRDTIVHFQSYEKDLVDFLLEDAWDNQKKNISVTYLWFDKKSKKLASYITILTDTINLSPTQKEEFRTKNITYKSLPALKIGRLCVSDDFLRKGIGSLMIQFAMFHVVNINTVAGCRFLTLDAMRNSDISKDPLHFYKKLGFKILRDREKGTIPMYRDLHAIIEEKKKDLKRSS